MHCIDLKVVLENSGAGPYRDLVTRRTGQLVRGVVEAVLATMDGRDIVVIDFGGVRCLDWSCADEIIAKLIDVHGRMRYFLLLGVTEAHRDALDAVLARRGLAAVARDRAERAMVLGAVSEAGRRVFMAMAQRGAVDARHIAEALALPLSQARQAIEELLDRRLAVAFGTGARVLRTA